MLIFVWESVEIYFCVDIDGGYGVSYLLDMGLGFILFYFESVDGILD